MGTEELYLRLRQVIMEMPNLRVEGVSSDLAQWLGQASYLVEECGSTLDIVEFRAACNSIGMMLSRAPEVIPTILYRSLARAEARAPSSSRGAFIGARQPFDALIAVSKLLCEVQSDVLIVDPYADANLLDNYLRAIPEQVTVRVLADAKKLKSTLGPAVKAWIEQFGPARPLTARAAPKGSLHDRLILIDAKHVWLIGQSFNALATRSHTYLSKLEPEPAQMKIDAYEALWGSSTPLTQASRELE